ncbi:substrate-binding domain-containing protein [Marinomonas rhodophyticola]|uniref:Substrate-binding domain-containing protein n=1 Tax=Marinomonas rhodophyticola TaxID=2992803 RepID=A0ABT3KG37_9GAMM|nr:substrate-binding domain-containing protein [Marinomonas sp. KJ51-3]MCW4629490.1 substrate-binding domain-containing protein [Marinomonas sp. KJ51-3]
MNIKDVAALAGVSPATVSRCLNKTAPLSDVVRARIEKVIELTGYDANHSSKQVDWNHNPTIGVMIPSLLNPVFSEIVAGIQQRAWHFGYSVVVVDTQYERSREKQAIIDLIRQRVIGVILTTTSVEDNEALSLLREFRFPFCLVHNQSSDEPCVYVDNYQAGCDVAEHLLSLGHRKIGMVAGRFQSSDRAKQRYLGFTERLNKEAALSSALLMEVDQYALTPFNQTQWSFFDSPSAPTAWFCSNDLLALKLVNHLKSKGVSVPESVSVIGFDGMALGQILYPPLATIQVPHHDMGLCAVDLLFNAKHNAALSLARKLDYQTHFVGTVAECQPSIM